MVSLRWDIRWKNNESLTINGELEGEAANDVPIAPSNLELWIGGDDLGNATDHFPGKN